MYDLNKEKQDYTQAFYELLLSIMTSSGGNLDLSAPRMTLIGTVRLKIDELQPQQEGVQFIDTGKISNVLDMYINGLLDECAKHILQTAPLHVIIPAEDFDAEVTPAAGQNYGDILLPEDYIRWVALRMNTWLQEVTEPITTRDAKYKLQKYAPTRGGVAKPVVALNSKRIDNGAAVAQVDTLRLSGSSGAANISCAGLAMTASFDTDLDTTAANFVAEYSAVLLAEGVILTYVGGDEPELVFTANTAGVPFTSPWIATTEGDLSGTVVHTTENQARYEMKRTAEYYSVKDGEAHTIDKFLYIGLTGAEFIQEDLREALTWLCASKVLQIMGNLTSQNGSAEKAMAQVELSYQNLL